MVTRLKDNLPYSATVVEARATNAVSEREYCLQIIHGTLNGTKDDMIGGTKG